MAVSGSCYITTVIPFSGSGHIDFNEFLVMMSQTKQKTGELELRQAFRLFDADNDGFITFDDLKRVMRNCGENLSDSELKHMFTKADVNNDNRVDMKGKWLLVTSCACSYLRLKLGLPVEINKTPPPLPPSPNLHVESKGSIPYGLLAWKTS